MTIWEQPVSRFPNRVYLKRDAAAANGTALTRLRQNETLTITFEGMLNVP